MAGEYLVEAAPRVCACKGPGKILTWHRKLERAIDSAVSHWSLYVGFWGESAVWLTIRVVDARDGRLLWQDGRRMTEREVAQYGTTLF